MTDFDSIRDELDAALPAWWQHRTPSSVLDQVLTVVSAEADKVATALQTIFDDQFLVTASKDALRTEWGPLFGAANEDLTINQGNLLAYLQAIADEDGTLDSLTRALVALVNVPANTIGTVLLFPADGSGLTFPADGSGLTLFEGVLSPLLGLFFPADGSGLFFPADGSGLTFPARGWIAVIQDFSTYNLTVQVLEVLAFDRAAFARAVNRHRMAHVLPPIIQEIP